MILIAGLSAVITLALWIPGTSTGAIIAFAVLFGFVSGGFIGISPTLIAQISDIRQIGVQFDSGDPYEGGSFTGPLDTVFHVDSITAQ